MEYPLNMTKPAKGNEPVGFAVANEEAEHQALTEQGYGPAYVAPAKAEKAKAEKA